MRAAEGLEIAPFDARVVTTKRLRFREIDDVGILSRQNKRQARRAPHSRREAATRFIYKRMECFEEWRPTRSLRSRSAAPADIEAHDGVDGRDRPGHDGGEVGASVSSVVCRAR